MTVTLALLVLMFSTGTDEIVRREAFFGSLFFETQDKSDGAIGVTMGVADPMPLFFLFVFLTALLTMVQITYRGLRQRRERLLEEIPGH
ncbi:hypothetical protein AAH978_06975 [Streptomyces sp. ZYX-F-203]